MDRLSRFDPATGAEQVFALPQGAPETCTIIYDYRIEGDDAPVGVELPAGLEQHRVAPTFRVGELHAITDGERTGSGHSRSACQQPRQFFRPGLPDMSDPSHRLGS